MKFIPFAFLLFACGCNLQKKKIDGAYKYSSGDSMSPPRFAGDKMAGTTISIFKNGYWTRISYREGADFTCSGGTYTIAGDQCIRTVIFHSADTGLIGKTDSFYFNIQHDQYFVESAIRDNERQQQHGAQFDKLITAEPLINASLEGVWKMKKGISGHTNGSNECIQIFSYPRFVKVFYNVRQKTFRGVFSGTYQFDGTSLIQKVDYKSAEDAFGTTSEWEAKYLPDGELQLFDIDGFYDEQIWIRI